MKLITLNIWAGSVYEPLMKFLKDQSVSTDIFCLQEVWNNPNPAKETWDSAPTYTRQYIFTEIANLLLEHRGYFAPSVDGIEGSAIFVKKDNIKVDKESDFLIFKPSGPTINGVAAFPRNLQYIKFENSGKEFTIANVHGIWNGGPKTDVPERLEQSKLIKEFLDNQDGAKILCGDFNLLPNTESLKMLEENMENLIKKYNIKSTRSSFYKKEARFADYTFVSPDVEVKNFEVSKVEVSDHLPMVLEFE